MRGAIPPLPQYAFMAWCSVKNKAQGQLYLLPYGRYTCVRLSVLPHSFPESERSLLLFCSDNVLNGVAGFVWIICHHKQCSHCSSWHEKHCHYNRGYFLISCVDCNIISGLGEELKAPNHTEPACYEMLYRVTGFDLGNGKRMWDLEHGMLGVSIWQARWRWG
jgi:hypothetical protein